MYRDTSLPRKLTDLSSNIDFHEWCENIGNQYFDECQESIPVNIQNYYSLRDIRKVEYSSSIASHARIIDTDSGFVIQLNKNKIKTKKQYNFFIAHEIAHTFFYEKICSGYTHLKNIIPGSNELEFACDRLGGCLLAPQTPLVNQLANYPSITDSDFSLKIINKFCINFGISHSLLLTRIVSNLNLWKNFILIRFKCFDVSISDWRITDSFNDFSNIKHHRIFIPSADKFKKWRDPKKYPSAQGNLLNLVQMFSNTMCYGQEQRVVIKSDDLSGKPIDSLSKYFEGKTFHNCIITKSKIGTISFINFFISLDEKFIN